MLYWRRVRTLLYRLVAWLKEARWIVLSLMLATIGVLGLLVPVPAAINVGLALVSLVLVVPEILDYVRSRQEIQFQERNADNFADVSSWLASRPRFELLGHRTGTFLLDRVASAQIAQGRTSALLVHEQYELPEEIRAPGRQFMLQRIAGRIDVFDGPVVGLDTNLGTEELAEIDVMRFTPGTYFAHLASDLFAARNVHLSRSHRSELGRSLVIDRRGMPRDFGDSWLLNAVGTSVVGITSDGWIVNVHQTKKNESAQDELAPSGSGSLEPQDFSPGATVREVAIAGALREMAAEAGIHANDITETEFLGLGRWMEKGGKPEMISVARLSIDSHAARRRRSARSDRPYSKFAEPCRLIQPATAWISVEVNELVERQHAQALSLPLYAALALMADAAALPESAAHDLLHRAMAQWRP